jgi:hypothetical protein
MQLRVRNWKDLYSGLIFLVCGALFTIVARNYPMGTALRMGPSYFPTILGSLLALLGVVIALRSLVVTGEPISPIRFRPLLLILAAVLLYGFLLDRLGLVIATVALIFVSALGGHEFRLREVLILTAILVALSVGAFVYGLGLPFPLWPRL